MTSFTALANELAGDIAAGRLPPGHRLPPQRHFAWKRGIAVSTASRVYGELGRRGLVTGEVGRGTYVREPGAAPTAALTEPRAALIDLEYNFPILPEQSALLSRSIRELLRARLFGAAAQPAGAAGTPAARAAAAAFLARPGWAVAPESLLFAGNGRQGLAAALASAAGPDGRVGVEPLTYAVIKGLASRLGLTLVPLAMDASGLQPGSVAAAHRTERLDAVYLQPTIHNPLGTTMPPRRRAELATLARELDLLLIEDGIYSFLADDVPVAALAPDHTIFVDSLSKRLAPGLTVGILVVPPARTAPVAAMIRSGAWGAPRFALEAATRWLGDGTARKVGFLKRKDAARRQKLARRLLAGRVVRGDPRAYHLWLELEGSWRAEDFAAAAARAGVALTPASAFAVSAGYSPKAVRLALGGPSLPLLESALRTIARLLGEPPPSAQDRD